jgi:putative tryptophan/tyrosine transport system substrate-binding protein
MTPFGGILDFGFSIGRSGKKIFCLALCAFFFTVCVSAEAEHLTKIPRIGYIGTVGPAARNPNFEAFRRGLQDLGYIDGKNILLEHRSLEGNVDRIPSIVAELVQLKVDVIVSPISGALRAAKQATKTIPIVMATTLDPVSVGLVESLAHPGGNITGVTRFTRELSGKRLELLQEALPGISSVGVLLDSDSADPIDAFKNYEAAAVSLKMRLQSLAIRGPNLDFERAFRAGVKARVSALITVTTPLFVPHAKRIADLAISNRLPSMFEGSEYVEVGGLMSYSGNDTETFRRAATYVDKILKGAKPADLPVEQPTKFEFVINLKAAKQIGLTVPPNVLARADRVIR